MPKMKKKKAQLSIVDGITMKSCNWCGVVKELDEFHRDKRAKDGHNGTCKICAIQNAKEWVSKNKERAAANKKRWDAEHPEYSSSYAKEWKLEHPSYMTDWREENHDHVVAYTNQWRKENPETLRKSLRKSETKWRKAHPAESCAKTMRRQAAKLQATPAWADHKLIQEKYDTAARMTKETGYQWDVDHIFPLRHKLFCGLHVDYNLQVITHTANIKKGNRVQL